MKNKFEAMHSAPTPAEECEGFTIINYRDISDIKSSRLCKVDGAITKEPYIVEVLDKRENCVGYKAFTFEGLEDAKKYQNGLK